jgi:phosphoglycolate phosphatase-like HAD superfamily hydrolase
VEAVAAVVFDFDGTLVDSAGLKRSGYRAGLAAVGLDATPAAWAAYDQHRFTNRRELLRRCFFDLTGAEPSVEDWERLCAGYTGHVTTHPEQVLVFPGLARFAERLVGIPLFVSSNAPMVEVESTCERLGLRRHFVAVFGHPLAKDDVIRDVAATLSAEVRNVVYVGDHPGDQEIAARAGARFVHLDPPGEFVEAVRTPSMRSLETLADFLLRDSTSSGDSTLGGPAASPAVSQDGRWEQ